MGTLGAIHVTDLPADTPIRLDNTMNLFLPDAGVWAARENEVKEMLTVVAFVAQVRTVAGKIWRFDEPSVMQELVRLNLKISSGSLEPTKETKSQ
jgi:hypothetical protein